MNERFMRNTVLFVGILLLAMAMFGQSALAGKWADTPSGLDLMITNVFVDTTNETILIKGQNFDSGDDPVVTITVGHVLTQLVSTLNNPNEISTSLPGGIAAGDYLLTVTTGTSVHNFDSYNLTIGGGGDCGDCVSQEEFQDLKFKLCADSDGDGYGDGLLCLGADCNDDESSAHAGATEICDNLVDEDCNGVAETCTEMTPTSLIKFMCREGSSGPLTNLFEFGSVTVLLNHDPFGSVTEIRLGLVVFQDVTIGEVETVYYSICLEYQHCTQYTVTVPFVWSKWGGSDSVEYSLTISWDDQYYTNITGGKIRSVYVPGQCELVPSLPVDLTVSN